MPKQENSSVLYFNYLITFQGIDIPCRQTNHNFTDTILQTQFYRTTLQNIIERKRSERVSESPDLQSHSETINCRLTHQHRRMARLSAGRKLATIDKDKIR